MSEFWNIAEQFPLTIAEAVWTGDVLTIGGAQWSFTTAGAWRIRTATGVRFGCYDDHASKEIESFVGDSVVGVEPMDERFVIDPRLVLASGELLEIFSTDTFEPWRWRLPERAVLVAAPGDPAWVSWFAKLLRGEPDTGA